MIAILLILASARRAFFLLNVSAAFLILPSVAHAAATTFVYVPPEGVKIASASVRGTMNNWGETAMERQPDGTWSVTIDLKPGEYEYKYFINGEWPKDMATALSGGPMDAAADDYKDDTLGGQNAVRRVGAGAAPVTPKENVEPAPHMRDGYARVHYHRPDGNTAGFGLHVWEDVQETVTWATPLKPAGQDYYGPFWDIRLKDGAKKMGFIIHKGDEKDPGPDMFVDFDKPAREFWIVSKNSTIFTAAPDIEALAFGDLSKMTAYWISRDRIAWNVPPTDRCIYLLSTAPEGGLKIEADGVKGGDSILLTLVSGELPPELRARFPFLRGYQLLSLPERDAGRAEIYLKGQIAISVIGRDGRVRDASGIQIAGVLDDILAFDGPIGTTWDNGTPSLSLWAPTARAVRLHLFDTSTAVDPSQTIAMTETRGVWKVTGSPDWKNKFYLYEVEVFVPSTGVFETNRVTDPYSRSLSTNSARSQIVDLSDPALQPEGWNNLQKPKLDAPEDIVLYELHVRDFSAMDLTVPEALRGTFQAFTVESNGTRHLRNLAAAGLTHVHLLPAFDIATIDEVKSHWKSPGDLSGLPPDSDQQQAAVVKVQNEDGFNWGYDPWHYGVPEGSYSTDPDGSRRIIEFRNMVKALSDMGLRVVMDVVYNHTNASGQDPQSVLDRIVPGYYHRLSSEGKVETSTCCQNTASENVMMEKLMIDDLVHWARDYKVDGFRFDLMGHHMKRNIEKARNALHALKPATDGVDGDAIYLYGEGWDFGEVQGGKRGVNATQPNMAGTGIGTFNDRIRDAIRGGNPFGDRREQGFTTGLFDDPSPFQKGGDGDRAKLLEGMDRLKVGLAGNLRGYSFVNRFGQTVRGADLNGTGYTTDPQEDINYAEAHDNETFFDKIQYAAPPGASLADRARMQMMALSLVGLAQGVPFFHAGQEMLRSKCMDADSYNSGDWFNRLDFSLTTNNFGAGLPPAGKNRERWPQIQPLLARSDLKPGRETILSVVEHFREILSIRRSSPLFRLRTADDIAARLSFPGSGPDQLPDLIVMDLSDDVAGLPDLDPDVEEIVVLFNASKAAQTFHRNEWRKAGLVTHPLQITSADPVLAAARVDNDAGAVTVPGRTTLVLIKKEAGRR